MMKKKVIFWGCVVVAFLGTLDYYFRNHMEKQRTRNNILFYKTNIEGRIKSLYVKNKGIGFSIDGVNETFVFYPFTDKVLNKNQMFYSVASTGDSLYKSAYSDTLFLYKENRVYKYTFEKEESTAYDM